MFSPTRAHTPLNTAVEPVKWKSKFAAYTVGLLLAQRRRAVEILPLEDVDAKQPEQTVQPAQPVETAEKAETAEHAEQAEQAETAEQPTGQQPEQDPAPEQDAPEATE